MKTLSLPLLLLLACGAARADALADAQHLWAAKNFAPAFQAFGKLAEAGNPAAQLQLGEMYGFGEGTPEDMGKARYWLTMAAAAGSPEAPASLVLLDQRAKRKPEILYYTTGFDAATLAYANYGCVLPQIPARSTSNADIKAVNGAVSAWSECYGRFARQLNAATPVASTIAKDVVALMSHDEFVRAGNLIGATYARLASEGELVADQVMGQSAAWKKATEEYIVQNNNRIDGEKKKGALIYDVYQRQAAEAFEARQANVTGRSR